MAVSADLNIPGAIPPKETASAPCAIPVEAERLDKATRSRFAKIHDQVGALKAKISAHYRDMSVVDRIFYIFVIVLFVTSAFMLLQNTNGTRAEPCNVAVRRQLNSTALGREIESYLKSTDSKHAPVPTRSLNNVVLPTYANIDSKMALLVHTWQMIDPAYTKSVIGALEDIQKYMRELYLTQDLSEDQKQACGTLFSEVNLAIASARATERTGLSYSKDPNVAISGSYERKIYVPVSVGYSLVNNGNPDIESEIFKNSFDQLLSLYTGTPRLMNVTTLEKIVIDYFMIICERDNKPSLVWGKANSFPLVLRTFSFKSWRDYMLNAVENLLK